MRTHPDFTPFTTWQDVLEAAVPGSGLTLYHWPALEIKPVHVFATKVYKNAKIRIARGDISFTADSSHLHLFYRRNVAVNVYGDPIPVRHQTHADQMPSITYHRIYRVAWTPDYCVVTSTITAALVATWTPEHGWMDQGRLPSDIRLAADGVKPLK